MTQNDLVLSHSALLLGANDVQVTAEDLASGHFLHVRRGSDPPTAFLGGGEGDEAKSWKSLPQSQASNQPIVVDGGVQGSTQSLATVSNCIGGKGEPGGI